MWPGEKASVLIAAPTDVAASCLGKTAFFSANSVAASMVGMERKNGTPSAAGGDMPAICPAAMVAIERDVPGNTAASTCTAPIHTACVIDMFSMSTVVGLS